MSSPPIRFVTTADGVSIAASTMGTGPTLVYSRGWVSHLELLWEDDAFRRFFEPIARHRCLVRFDMRGNGLSGRAAELSFDGFVADLEAVVDGFGVERSNSWGAPTAPRSRRSTPPATPSGSTGSCSTGCSPGGPTSWTRRPGNGSSPWPTCSMPSPLPERR